MQPFKGSSPRPCLLELCAIPEAHRREREHRNWIHDLLNLVPSDYLTQILLQLGFDKVLPSQSIGPYRSNEDVPKRAIKGIYQISIVIIYKDLQYGSPPAKSTVPDEMHLMHLSPSFGSSLALWLAVHTPFIFLL